MLAFTYAMSGILLAATGYLFMRDLVSVRQIADHCLDGCLLLRLGRRQRRYLTVSETFPLEMRALAIAFFYAIGTGIGGVFGPWLLGALIETGSRGSVFAGYLFGAALMVIAARVAARWAIAAERRPLEEVAPPLAAAESMNRDRSRAARNPEVARRVSR